MCCFVFFDNERVVVIKQSIMVLPVEKQYELLLLIGILLKHRMSSSEVPGFVKCLTDNKVLISKRKNEKTLRFFTFIV